MIGRELGQYRIDDKLGAGGMGIVYRAHDLRNHREVALKTLQGSALPDAERRARFRREAELASSLNHPNIIKIYEIGSANVDGADVDYIAMELIRGETLDQIIKHSALPESAAIDYGIQIASGLAAAHAEGIVHRDLKPSNVIIAEGAVKILDFGLAKMAAPLQQATASGATRSVRLGLTVEGTIMGSVAYMSPEQAEGKPADPRTDIFSLGSVLYEMLSGKQAFPGDSHLGSLSAVLLKEPTPLSASKTSAGLRSVVMKCLRKNPEKRWQSMADVRLVLEELRDEAPALAEVKAQAASATRRGWLLAAAGLAAGLAPTAYLATRNRPMVTFERLTFRRGDIWNARFGPNGEVYYSASWDGSPQATYMSIHGSRDARDIGLPPGKLLSVNARGEALVLLGEDSIGTLARAGVTGGAPKELLKNVEDATWGPDGTSIAAVRFVEGKHRLEYPIGTVLYESEARPPLRIRAHPSKGSFGFFLYDSELGDYDVIVVDSSRQVKVLSRGLRPAGGIAWNPSGSELWFSGARSNEKAGIFAVDMSGNERLLVQPVGFMLLHDVSHDGSMLAASMNTKVTIQALGSMAPEERDLGWLDASRVYDISADGKTILFVELAYGEGRNSAIYLRPTDGGPAVKLGYGIHPALSPDGNWIVSVFRDSKATSLRILAAGAGEERSLVTDGMKYESAEWLPDQKRLLVTASDAGKPVRTYVRSIDGGASVPVTPEGVRAMSPSPDGRMAVALDGNRIRTVPIPPASGESRELGELKRGDQILRWSDDGEALLIGRSVPDGVELHRMDLRSKQYRKLREVRYPEVRAEFTSFTASPNGKWFAVSYQKDLAELYLVRGAGS